MILALGSLGLGVNWLAPGSMLQMRMLRSYALVGITATLLLIWAVFLSRFSTALRCTILTISVLVPLAFFVLVRVTGVSGDFVPVLDWRWESPPGQDTGLRTNLQPTHPSGRVNARPESAATPRPAGELQPAASTLPGARDYPQFLGPHRNATLDGPMLARDWSVRPPQERWRIRVGAGWSSFAVVGDLAITQEQRGKDETVIAYSLGEGEIRWSHAYPAFYSSVIAGDGPRATPTVDDRRVYTLGSTGVLSCLGLADGNLVWQRDIVAENGATLDRTEWGKSCSPLVVDGKVIVSAGGSPVEGETRGRSLVAYDQLTGELLWHGGSSHSSYSSPLVAELLGVRQALILNRDSLAGHDLEDGRLLWQHAWPGEFPSVAQPLPVGEDRVLVSAGYGVGSKLLRLTRSEQGDIVANLEWESRVLRAKFANFIRRDTRVYGLSDGIMTCMRIDDGERVWKGGRYGHGQMILVGDLLLVQTEDGFIVLVEPTAEGHRELTRFRVMTRKTWNSPALAGRYLLVRNDREAACLELPLRD